jgi:glycosyltransferase involved in cell wall biosynthesis
LVCTNPDYFEQNRDSWPSRLIPNGVDPSMFSPGPGLREEFDLPEGVPLVLMVSALIESKRVDEGIRAAARVPGLHLLICGQGPEREKIQRLGNELMPGRFHARALQRSQMPKMYRCADIFLHMSLDEPSANAYIEALASGLPIVTHDRVVTRWTLEQTGVLVDATDLDAVAAGLLVALNKRTESDMLKRRKLAEERFSWSGIARQYHAFFREILSAEHFGKKQQPI